MTVPEQFFTAHFAAPAAVAMGWSEGGGHNTAVFSLGGWFGSICIHTTHNAQVLLASSVSQ